MARYTYERLSAQDASFLWAEKSNQPMHVGAVAILEAAPLELPDGGVDIDAYRNAVESVLHWIPRYRQKIEWTPLEGWPVWVDDRRFDIGYHIRHIALPRPGRLEQLKELVGRINARPLDRQHALWEIWVIEGVEGGTQVALLNKIHHCMIDGAAGADLSQILMSPSARVEPTEPMPYMPRPVPTRTELLRDSIGLGVRRPLDLLRNVLLGGEEFDESDPGLSRRLRSLLGQMEFLLKPASKTPINGNLSPHRRLEWLTMPLDEVRDLRRELDCTVNDIVLATVTGAMRRYLFRRRVDHRTLDFRVAAPVSMRRPDHDRRQGNHVSSWVVPLPLEMDDPLDQLTAIHARTEKLKRSEASLAVDTVMRAAEWMPRQLIERGTRLASGSANMIVTNVPGPQFPLFMLGARMFAMYPIVPLLPGGGLGVALFSYDGKLCWGFNGDHELLPDLGAFVDDVRHSFEALRGAAVSRYMERRTAAATSEPKERLPVSSKLELEPDSQRRSKRNSRPTENRTRVPEPNADARLFQGEPVEAIVQA